MFEACIQAFSHLAWSGNWSYFKNSSLCPSCVCWCLPLFISSNFALLLCAFLFVSWSLRLRWCSSECLSRVSWRGLLYFSAPVERRSYKLETRKKTWRNGPHFGSHQRQAKTRTHMYTPTVLQILGRRVVFCAVWVWCMFVFVSMCYYALDCFFLKRLTRYFFVASFALVIFNVLLKNTMSTLALLKRSPGKADSTLKALGKNIRKWTTFWGHQNQAKQKTHVCTSTVPCLGRHIRRTYGGENFGDICRGGQFERPWIWNPIVRQKIRESLTPNSVPKYDPSFGVTTRTSLLSSH